MIPRLFKTLRNVALTWLGLLALSAAFGAPTPAGTVVTNTATGSYVDSISGFNFRLTSNTVATSIQPFEALLLTNSQTVSRTPGGHFELPHQLTNTGNVATTYAINFAALGSSLALPGLRLIQDLNANGVVDVGEPELASGSSVMLVPGAVMNLMVVGIFPATSTSGQSAQIRITATSQVQRASATNTDVINAVNGAAISVTQAASTDTPVPGGDITLSLKVSNSGDAAAGTTSITVDGVRVERFLLRSGIPANTGFLGLSGASNNGTVQLLYHRLGDPAGTYVTAQPAQQDIDGVAWALAGFPGSEGPSGAGVLTGTLRLSVHANASGRITNVGFADFSIATAALSEPSNAVQLGLPARPPTITFYATNAYTSPMQQAPIGSTLYVQINAAQCNTEASAVETRTVTLISQLTGDAENFTATETAPNSGIFRILPNVPTANAAVKVVASGNGVLEVLRNDGVVASLNGCGSSSVTTTLLIDPSGTVFDSKTNVPVAGATVKLIDVTGAGNGGAAGGPAVVFEPDGATPAPATVLAGADGSYNFPFVPASQYKLLVTPPNGYAFPSKLAPSLLPPGRSINASGSYGESFPVTVAGGAVVIDVPLDSSASAGLLVQKTASKSLAEVGDFVNYSVTIKNNTGKLLTGVIVNDQLPAGFAFIASTARLNGAALANPSGGAGPQLAFGVGNIGADAQSVLTYRLRIGAGADAGNGTNTAQASSGLTRSNVASAAVKITGGVFSDKAYLIGKVFADCNANQVQDADEPGVPGVRIYLDNGTFAITDVQGKYSLYGLTPRTHVVKVDASSLPTGATLQITGNRNAQDPASRFADLRHGELHKADFAIAQCSAQMREALSLRREAAAAAGSEIYQSSNAKTALTPTPIADARSLAASGLMGQNSGNPAAVSDKKAIAAQAQKTTNVAVPATGDTASTDSPAHAISTPKAAPTSLESLLPELTAQPGFIDLQDDSVMPTDQIRVRVKGPMGAQLRLSVNGQVISDQQVGEKSSLERTGVVAWEYVGINLRAGVNTLTLSVVDGFGNSRGETSARVTAPGKLEQIQWLVPEQAQADGSSPVKVTLKLLDAQGVPVTSRTPLTLSTTLGEWQVLDLDPKEPGVQTFVEGGIVTFTLLPPADPGKATLRAASGTVQAKAELVYLPNLRPLVAAGVVEGVISLRNLNPNALVPTRSGDVFEREIQSVSKSFDNGKGSAAARASMFLKGKVLGSSLLTLAYDSDKPADTALFRDIQPDRFYPVYGDSSVKGYDAQSTGKLYVRIDQGTSYALYGDYSTQGDNAARVLSQYSRVLNGAKGRYEDDSLTVDGFASYTNATQVVDEIAANGTSGPYRLSRLSSLVNSQRVEIVTRDRNQPNLVLSIVPLASLTDYAIEPLSGQVLFKSPIASLDADLNPVFVRVTYEVSTGGPRYWVAGTELRRTVTEGLTLGVSYIRDANVANAQSLSGVTAFWTINPQSTLTAELAQSGSDLLGAGKAGRLEFKHASAGLQARVYAVKTDLGFDNASSTFSAGASELGVKLGYTLDDKTRLIAEAIKSTASGTLAQIPGSLALPSAGGGLTSSAANPAMVDGASRQAASVGIERSLPLDLKLTLSLRRIEGNTSASLPSSSQASSLVSNDYTSVRARLDAPVPGLPEATAFVQYEQAVGDSQRSATTLGGTYQLAPQTKLYATHQTSNSLSGDNALNPTQQSYATVAGIDTTYMDGGQLFSEYRLGDSIDGRSARAATGLRNLWAIAPGVGVSTSVQQLHPIAGVVSDKSTALTGAIEYTGSEFWKGSSRLEWSKAATTQTWLATLAAAAKIDDDYTALGRVTYNTQTGNAPAAGAIRLRQAQLGLAYRPVDSNTFNALARLEFKRNRNSTLGPGLNVDEAANIFSTHLNYQPSANVTFNGRYGVKWAADYADGLTSTYTSQLIGGRATLDIGSHWDAGVQYFVTLGGKGLSVYHQAIGFEVGYLVKKNLWVAGGFNIKGFRDPDLAGDDFTQRGAYVRLRFKFDETAFESVGHGNVELPITVKNH